MPTDALSNRSAPAHEVVTWVEAPPARDRAPVLARPGPVPAAPRRDAPWAAPHSPNPTILVGAGATAFAAWHEVVESRDGFHVLGYVADSRERRDDRLAPVPCLGEPDDLAGLVASTGARVVVLAQEGSGAALRHPPPAGVEVLDFPGLCERLTGRIPIDHVDERWLQENVFSLAPSGAYGRIRRGLDIGLSLAALAGLGVLFPLLALAVCASTKGSVIYRQERVGFRGRPFRVFKLRTMRTGAEQEGVPVWADADDPRITRVGRFLRATRLDEVPQFWNVLRGEMGVVGPRPERPYFVAMLREEIPHYDRRHEVLPGITGWAQVRQGYAASASESFRKLEHDLFYIRHRSLALDLHILWKTVGVVLGRKGSR